MAELCRKYGVSRPTGYAWVKRFRDGNHDVRSVEEKSRRPQHNPHAISAEVEDLVVQARKAMPRRGPRKLRKILVERYAEVEWPSTSSIGNILKRRGLVRLKRKRKHAPAMTHPFATTVAPNDTWCIDFKGKFRLRDGQWCHVLTLLDADTRYLLRAETMLDLTGDNVERVLDSAFQEFGLPKAMRPDNGPPFASTGAGRLSRLSVWWMKLGIELERIKPPARLYRASPRRYPRKLIKADPAMRREACDVDRGGCIRWRKHKLFITSALAGEVVELERYAESTWHIRFLNLVIAELDERKLDRGIILKRKPRRVEV